MRRIPHGSPAQKVDRRHGYITDDTWAFSGKWVLVKSSNVSGIAYDARERNLFVQFHGSGKRGTGAVYKYYGVPVLVAKDFFRASSMGRFVHQHLKGKYPYVRLEG